MHKNPARKQKEALCSSTKDKAGEIMREQIKFKAGYLIMQREIF